MAKDLLFEIGAEEIPASFIAPALEKMAATFTAKMSEARLAHGAVKTFGTPRRLALWVAGVAERSEDISKEVLGPSAKAAFDGSGKPTVAAEKFAAGHKLAVDQLKRVTTPKGEYLAAQVEEKGKPALELLPGALHTVAHAIDFKKSMRWGDVELAFARPVHWMVALFGEEIVPVVLGDVKSARSTFGHRFLSPQALELRSPAGYEAALEKANVVPDVAKRRAMTLERIQAAAKQAGGKLLEDSSLLDQVTNLVELPNPVVGTFDDRHLDLPPEVLIQEMKSHQRYFSLTDASGKLLPKFIAVSNTPVRDEKLSLRGYERVLRARLADGRFFFDEDRKTKLADRLPKLERVVWQGKLGSYAEKVARIRKLSAWIVGQVPSAKSLAAEVDRAAELCKADLVTGMVGEFPELQGVMGREYAKASGERPEVALGIFEHYLPRNASDSLPTQDVGAIVGLADRLDTLAGLFAIGKKPSASADPFGLRRACLALVNVILSRGYRFSLSGAIDEALQASAAKFADVKRKPGEPAPKDELLAFVRERLRSLWSEGRRADVVEAVLAAGFDDLVSAKKRLDALSQLVGRADFTPLAIAFKRVANIVEKQGSDVSGNQPDPARFQDDAERALHAAFEKARASVEKDRAGDDYGAVLGAITQLKLPVDHFFDKVMVMAEDKALRENRIRFLKQIGGLFNQVADFTKIQAEV